MFLSPISALLLAASTVHAFKNTSPFLLLSSEPLKSNAPLQSTNLALTGDVEDRLMQTLDECDRKWYYIFTQEHVSANDISDGGMPKLQKRVAGAAKGTVVEIPEVNVNGELSAQSIKARLEKACSNKGKKGVESWPEGADEYRVLEMDLPMLPNDVQARGKAIRDTDDAMDDTVASVLGNENRSVLIYITSPPAAQRLEQQDGHLYEMDEPYPSALHTDLKRDLNAHKRQSDNNEMQAGLPLFEKYQFVTPAIFMGLMISLLLFLILYVGITAISGLEVSYMAFNKDLNMKQQGKQQ